MTEDLTPPSDPSSTKSVRPQSYLRNKWRGNSLRVQRPGNAPVPEDPDKTIPLDMPYTIKSAIEDKLLQVLHLKNYVFRFPYRYRYREHKIKKLSLTEWKLQEEIVKIRSTNFIVWPQYNNTYWIDAEIHKSSRIRRMITKLWNIWKVENVIWSTSTNPNFDHARFIVSRRILHKWSDFADRHSVHFEKKTCHNASGELQVRFGEYLAYINMPMDFQDRFPYLYKVIRDQWIANIVTIRNNKKIQKMIKELRTEFTFFVSGAVELYNLLGRNPTTVPYLKDHPEEKDKLEAIEAVMKPWIDPKFYPHKIIDVEMLLNEQKKPEA